MGAGRKLIALSLAVSVLTVMPVVADASTPPDSNPWLHQKGILNMAHQGGEFEAPSSTMYAFRTALEDRGADTLEMDVNVTSDDQLAVMHDYYTRRITPLDAQVRDLTMAELQALDAAWWYSPGKGQFDHTLPPESYPLRGVRTGDRPPPEGYSAEDFRIPTIVEVLDAFPNTPLNIEIKSIPNEAEKTLRSAGLLAEILSRSEYRDRRIIVAALDQSVIEHFHALAPHVGVASSVLAMVNFIGSGKPILPDPVALQVPMVLGDLDPPRELQARDVNGQGYAVHTWTDGADTENDESYGHLISSGVQGIMTSAPSKLHDYLCRTGQRRPDGAPRCDAQVMNYGLTFPSSSLRQYLKKGLPVRAECDQACTLALEVRVKPREARRLRIKGVPRDIDRGLILIGTQRRVTAPSVVGANVFRANAFRQPYKRLARARKVSLEITVNVFDGAGWKQAVERRWITLKSERPLKRPPKRRR